MNDDELLTLVREQRDKIPMTTPLEEIVTRGRSVRARRRIPVVAGTGALALAAGAAAAVATLLPASQHLGQADRPAGAGPSTGAGHSVSAQLAAWTVARQANGDITVTIRQLQDPAGLQATLRADGVPVTVSFTALQPSASCRLYNFSLTTMKAVVQVHSGDGSTYLVIDPSALPGGAGLAIFDKPEAGLPTAPAVNARVPGLGAPPPGMPKGALPMPPPRGLTGPLAFTLVYASPQCTG
jgi:hypothetical protein